jgi:hypothetical protein
LLANATLLVKIKGQERHLEIFLDRSGTPSSHAGVISDATVRIISDEFIYARVSRAEYRQMRNQFEITKAQQVLFVVFIFPYFSLSFLRQWSSSINRPAIPPKILQSLMSTKPAVAILMSKVRTCRRTFSIARIFQTLSSARSRAADLS